MSNLAKLEFAALDITGKNYLAWVLNAEINLDAKGLGDTIMKEKEASNQDKAKAMIFLHHHLHEGLKVEHLTVKDPLELWNILKERYDHQKTIIMPKARYDWVHLRLQDFKFLSEYNSVIFKISSQLKLCGENITDEDLLEKKNSTFQTSNVLLQQQYHEKGFKKYSEFISYLLVSEQNNELLMKNYEACPTGSAPFPEVNVATHNNFERRKNYSQVATHNNFEMRQNYSRVRGQGRGRGRGQGNRPNIYRHHYRNKQENNKGPQSNSSRSKDNICHSIGHEFVVLQNILSSFIKLNKEKENNVETNLTFKIDDIEANLEDDFAGLTDITHLDVTDFLDNNN